MSYSRWGSGPGSGKFYVFWCSSSAKRKENEVLSICLVKDFTYKQLKNNIYKCLGEVYNDYRKNAEERDIFNIVLNYLQFDDFSLFPTVEEMEELKGYMLEFIRDVDQDYSEKINANK
jgi:hypothetical protein